MRILSLFVITFIILIIILILVNKNSRQTKVCTGNSVTLTNGKCICNNGSDYDNLKGCVSCLDNQVYDKVSKKCVPKCTESVCKNGSCKTGICICNIGYDHPDDSGVTCVDKCEKYKMKCENGSCKSGVCTCNIGYEHPKDDPTTCVSSSITSCSNNKDCIDKYGFCDELTKTCKCVQDVSIPFGSCPNQDNVFNNKDTPNLNELWDPSSKYTINNNIRIPPRYPSDGVAPVGYKLSDQEKNIQSQFKPPTVTDNGDGSSTIMGINVPKNPGGEYRTFVFINMSNQTVRASMTGNDNMYGYVTSQQSDNFDLSELGGIELKHGDLKFYQFKVHTLSGRIWPRTGCQKVKRSDGKALMRGDDPSVVGVVPCLDNDKNCPMSVCDTGSCGSGFLSDGSSLVSFTRCNDDAKAGDISGDGVPPATLVEFTLDNSSGTSNDFYDMSNIDGHTLGMEILPIKGRFDPASGNGIPKGFNCADIKCKIVVPPEKWCPPEIIHKTPSDGKNYCYSICKASTTAEHIDQNISLEKKMSNNTTKYSDYLTKLSTENDYFEHGPKGNQPTGLFRDRLCCACQKGSSCGSPNCKYGCSPYVTTYGPDYDGKKCDNLEGDTMYPEWPLSSQDTHYAKIYSEQCPGVYSWQFNDSSSTSQCRSADYIIIFYPGPNDNRWNPPSNYF